MSPERTERHAEDEDDDDKKEKKVPAEAAKIISALTEALRKPGRPNGIKTAGYLGGAVGAVAATGLYAALALSAPPAAGLFLVMVLGGQQVGRWSALRRIRKSTDVSWSRLQVLKEDMIEFGVYPDYVPHIIREVVAHAPDAINDPKRIISALSPKAFLSPVRHRATAVPAGKRLTVRAALPVLANGGDQ